MEWALVDGNGIVQDIIVWDGKTPFIPPAGLAVQQINPWVQIGQAANTPQPPPPVIVTPIPDLATQLAAALIAANVIPVSALNPVTLATVNNSLTAAGQTAITLTGTSS